MNTLSTAEMDLQDWHRRALVARAGELWAALPGTCDIDRAHVQVPGAASTARPPSTV